MNKVQKAKHACLITPGNLSSTPRLLREAISLKKSGYEVTVVAGTLFTPLEQEDRKLAEKNGLHFRKPRLHQLPWLVLRVLSKILQRVLPYFSAMPVSLCILALHPISLPLTRCARSVIADVYHGHCLGGLYAATRAARHHYCIAGFDIEDFHAAEQSWNPDEKWKPDAIHSLMKRLLPSCSIITTASPGISQESGSHYSVITETLLNTYPLSEAPEQHLNLPTPSAGSAARLYWFSQTIGPGRGLENALQIISSMKTPCEFYLRGHIRDEYRTYLLSQCKELGVRESCLNFLKPAPATEMVQLSADYHLGLCVEDRTPLNKDICLANKIFAYLLAGTPVWLSTTSAHRQLSPELGIAACLTDLTEHKKAAQQLDLFLSRPASYSQARCHAWELGRKIYNWDAESARFLQLVGSLTNN
ncbi:MAG: hypothetical protein AAF649_01200 [Verrucomicrobiota bacterium]